MGMSALEAKEAIGAAKRWVTEVFAEEGVMNLGLEEIRHDGDGLITIGFSRPWTIHRGVGGIFAPEGPVKRGYKVVRVGDRDGKIESITDRIIEPMER